MPLEYQHNQRWEELLPVLEEHTEWFHDLVQCVFYPDQAEVQRSLSKPTSFAQWVVYANRQEDMQPEIVEKLSNLHVDLFKRADILLHTATELREKPSFKDFNEFMTVFEEFLVCTRRLEKDLLIEGQGYDSHTGLRSKKQLLSDVKREMSRLERQGKSFCLALVKIDDYDKWSNAMSSEEQNGYIKLISDLIKLSIRSFDDAYYMGGDEFVISLKQTDVSGGISALERLRNQLEQQKVQVTLEDNQQTLLSMSCCIAEPIETDEIKVLLDNLRDDLKNTREKNSDSVFQYHELSPLQRYVQQEGSA